MIDKTITVLTYLTEDNKKVDAAAKEAVKSKGTVPEIRKSYHKPLKSVRSANK
jgi:hypothetical protein